ncbi:MAG: hypothetical protein AAGI17_09745, partial [Planctomycetota bacterium]
MPPSNPSKMTLEQIKSEAALIAALLKYTKRTLCDENLLFYFAKGDPLAIYDRYVDMKSKSPINIGSGTRRKCEAARASNDKTVMKKALTPARNEIRTLITSDIMPKFIKSREYAAYAEPIRRKEANTAVV